MPDYREYEFARSGFIPLVHRRARARRLLQHAGHQAGPQFKDPKDSENSQLVTNLAYTFSITRARALHEVHHARQHRQHGGCRLHPAARSTLAARYVTTVVNPDDLTLRRYPFKAYQRRWWSRGPERSAGTTARWPSCRTSSSRASTWS